MALKIRIDRDLCIGAGTCVVFAPNTFELDDELKAVLKGGSKLRDKEIDVIAAAKSCPVLAIFLEDKSGEQIFP